MKILFLDVETGGLDEINNSLLTIGLVIWENGKILESKEIFISKEKYNFVQAALDINKIDLNELREKGISEKEAINEIEKLCYKYFNQEKIIITGHNVAFDIGFIKNLYKRNNQEFSRFSYRFLDTGIILKFMYMQGKFKNDISTLDKALEYFKIKILKEKRHSALGDALATAELFNKLLKK